MHIMRTMYLKYSWKTLHRISSISSWQQFPIIKGKGSPTDQSTVTTSLLHDRLFGNYCYLTRIPVNYKNNKLQRENNDIISTRAFSISRVHTCALASQFLHSEWTETLSNQKKITANKRLPFTVGGASSVSLIASRKSNNASHVSLVRLLETCAKCCSVRNTRWQRTAWRFIVSAPVTCFNLQ